MNEKFYNSKLIEQVDHKMKDFPLYSQESSDKELTFHTKIFNPNGSGVWYIAEYDSDRKEGFGYVTGLGHNELGYFSLNELASIQGKIRIKIGNQLLEAEGEGLEVDECFTEISLSELVKLYAR